MVRSEDAPPYHLCVKQVLWNLSNSSLKKEKNEIKLVDKIKRGRQNKKEEIMKKRRQEMFFEKQLFKKIMIAKAIILKNNTRNFGE